MKKIEEWKDISDFEGLYQVSNLGRIKALPKEYLVGGVNSYSTPEKIMRLKKEKNGYYRIKLSKDGAAFHLNVHRLVALAFIPPVEGKIIINHKDGNKSNNTVENLEWCTQSENHLHAFRTGIRSQNKGFKDKKYKLKESDIVEIQKLLKSNVSQAKIAKQYNVSQPTISNFKKNHLCQTL